MAEGIQKDPVAVKTEAAGDGEDQGAGKADPPAVKDPLARLRVI